MNKKYCLALDLKNDPDLIKAYEAHHQNIWPEIRESIRASGIVTMELYRWENRLFMIMETEADFTFENKKQLDDANEKVIQWENLMFKYQQSLPGTNPKEKWQLMSKIFELK